MSGMHVLNEHQVQADYIKIYFDGTATSRDVIVDDVKVVHVPQNCQKLVLNPSFEDGSSFWSYIDRGGSKVSLFSPGAGGASDFALRSYARSSSSWRGV